MTGRGRCLNPQTIEFPTLASANRVREQFSDLIIPRDDARKKTVAFCGDAPERAQKAIGQRAHRSFERADSGFGQTALTRFERREIDFSRTNIFHSRACKAIACEFVVDDWLSQYDHTLTVSEHVEIYQRAGQPTASASGPTMREVAGWSV
ncbi:hypothetical protein [Halocatena marina]|uniref:hypothetical protein n=1 Tax=Halocatena marina TaxID=2934937 RepID=UPI00200F1817|nr:hypothetical protein [Halocatena marina]